MKAGVDCPNGLPWLAGPWATLHAYRRSGRVPPALLVYGPDGTGKTVLARAFSARLLCTSEDSEFACGACGACRLVEAGTHPDFLLVESTEPGKALKTEVVRDVVASLSLRPQYRHNRVVLVPGADLMNRYAANSLLKALEEPDPQTHFVLIAANPGAVPATIRSRCQRVGVTLPPRAMTVEWLRSQSPSVADIEARVAAAGGSPLRALALDESRVAARCGMLQSFGELTLGSADPIEMAAWWEKQGAEELVSSLIAWLEDLIRLGSAASAQVSNNPDLAAALRELSGRLDPLPLFVCLDLAYRAKGLLSSQLNRTLLLEELAIACARTGGGERLRGDLERNGR